MAWRQLQVASSMREGYSGLFHLQTSPVKQKALLSFTGTMAITCALTKRCRIAAAISIRASERLRKAVHERD